MQRRNYDLVIHPRVTKEKRRVYLEWELDRSGSGERFLQAINDCYRSILLHPYGYQCRKGNIRHAILQKLKFRVAFRVEGNTIIILEIRHTSRKPTRYGP